MRAAVDQLLEELKAGKLAIPSPPVPVPVPVPSPTTAPTHRGRRFLNIKEVKAKTGLGHTTIYRAARDGEFPMWVKAGRATRWHENEIDAWLASRPRG